MSRFIVGGALVLALTPPAPQAPGDGWVMSPSQPRMVKLLYWATQKQTEVWVYVTPRNKDGDEIPASLVFSAVYSGDVSKPGAITRPPDQITLLAQASPLAFHLTPTLALKGDGHALTLSPPNGGVLYGASCESCGATSIRVLLTRASLTALTHSSEVSGNVLGMTCHLERDDLDAIRKFAREVALASR